MAFEPKPRPRAFRLGAMTPEPRAAAPKEAMVIETLADPYEAEAAAFLAGRDAGEEAVEAAQKQGVAARSLLSWGGLFW